jgi:hypothetical protein
VDVDVALQDDRLAVREAKTAARLQEIRQEVAAWLGTRGVSLPS